MHPMHEAAQVMERIIADRGDAPLPDKPDFTVPAGTTRCACGKKFIPMGDLRYFNTEFVRGVLDSICKECAGSVKGMVPIVCVKCKAVVARVQPYRFENGFEFRKDKMYHTDACPNCDPQLKSGVRSSRLIEKHVYETMNAIK